MAGSNDHGGHSGGTVPITDSTSQHPQPHTATYIPTVLQFARTYIPERGDAANGLTWPFRFSISDKTKIQNPRLRFLSSSEFQILRFSNFAFPFPISVFDRRPTGSDLTTPSIYRRTVPSLDKHHLSAKMYVLEALIKLRMDTHGVGVRLSQDCHWAGDKILEVAIAALTDANFHAEAARVQAIYERVIADFYYDGRISAAREANFAH